jgi:hypothetical protein
MQDEMIICFLDEIIGSLGVAYINYEKQKQELYLIRYLIDNINTLKTGIANNEIINTYDFAESLYLVTETVNSKIEKANETDLVTDNLTSSYLFLARSVINKIILQINRLDNSLKTFKSIKKDDLLFILEHLSKLVYGVSVYLS